jgi:hypothetical protein
MAAAPGGVAALASALEHIGSARLASLIAGIDMKGKGLGMPAPVGMAPRSSPGQAAGSSMGKSPGKPAPELLAFKDTDKLPDSPTPASDEIGLSLKVWKHTCLAAGLVEEEGLPSPIGGAVQSLCAVGVFDEPVVLEAACVGPRGVGRFIITCEYRRGRGSARAHRPTTGRSRVYIVAPGGAHADHDARSRQLMRGHMGGRGGPGVSA